MEDLGSNGRILLKLILDKLEWSHLVPDAVQWWGLVNTAMDLRVPSNGGEFRE
jgi:hypothetical protein